MKFSIYDVTSIVGRQKWSSHVSKFRFMLNRLKMLERTNDLTKELLESNKISPRNKVNYT